jgi:murein DD-endopeptidase MepM/ murein hydrolase activator NlpD
MLVLAVFASAFSVHADIGELQAKIDARNAELANLEKEIEGYQQELEKIGMEANTLQNAISALDITRKKLSAEIKSTEGKIAATALSIDALTENIDVQEIRIGKGNAALEKALRGIASRDSESFVGTMLSSGGFSDMWREADELFLIQAKLSDTIHSVKEQKAGLESDRNELSAKKRKLAALKEELSDRKKIADANRAEQQRLLTQTKNKETNYQKLLDDKLALKNAFEQELLEYELQLKFELDPSKLPVAGSGVLKWPLDFVKITQYFGNTSFAQTGAYKGKGHNGVDFRAAIGTPVKSALGGVVKGTGDTDATCRSASYGKWVLIEHGNGLSTLYAHFSLIRVASGQSVNTGEVIGYSGNTGYSTGPHLHLTVFATQGVEIGTLKSRVCNATYTMPLANPNAYLNPLQYL